MTTTITYPARERCYCNPKIAPILCWCLADDASWLRGRVHAHLLRVIHPRISLEVCEQYGILRISQVVTEMLDRDVQPEIVSPSDTTHSAVSMP